MHLIDQRGHFGGRHSVVADIGGNDAGCQFNELVHLESPKNYIMALVTLRATHQCEADGLMEQLNSLLAHVDKSTNRVLAAL